MSEQNFNPIPLSKLIPGMAAEPFQNVDIEHTSYRPTIVIGLGGTGLSVVRRLKKLLRRYYHGDEMDIFQFVVFDTAAQEVPEGEEPLEAGEFVHLGAFDAADMIRHLSENPVIARWWPGGVEKPYRPSFAGTGANRVRAVGRLVLYNYLSSTIIPRLEAKIDRAVQINAQHGMGATSIKIYVICSLVGGTGSGMVVDLAYVARMLGLARQPTAYVTGVLVLDDAFLPKAHTEYTRAEFRANTYQALREINHFSSTCYFKEVYDDITSTQDLPAGFRPFDITYLLGLHNAEGQALESFDSLADMAAAEVMLEIASPLHGRTENVLDNVRANERSIAGQPAAYSSFALSSLVFPLQGVASWCALATYPEFVRRAFLSPLGRQGSLDADVPAFIQRAGVENRQDERLVERLNRGASGEATPTPALSHEQASLLPADQVLCELQRMEDAALGALDRIKDDIGLAVGPLQRTFAQDLQTEADAALRDPQRGVQYLLDFLKRLEEQLQAQREKLAGDQAACHAAMDGREAAWRAAGDALGHTLRQPGWLPWIPAQQRAQIGTYAAAFNAYLNAAHQLELHARAVDCCNDFIEQARRIYASLLRMAGEWERTAQNAGQRAATSFTQERAMETEYSLMHSIITQDELERLRERWAPDLQDEGVLQQMVASFWDAFSRRCPGWQMGGQQELQGENHPPAQSYYFLAEWYARRLSGQTLLERLQEIYGRDWRREIELRFRQTSPFWNFNLSRFGSKIRNNLQNEPRLVGYGEDNLSAWSAEISRSTGEPVDGVNNKNHQEMIFLNTSHGLPLFALRSISQNMRTAYQYLQGLWTAGKSEGSNPIPLFISSEWEKEMGDLEPRTAEELHPVPGLMDLPEAEPLTPAPPPNGHKPQAEPAA